MIKTKAIMEWKLPQEIAPFLKVESTVWDHVPFSFSNYSFCVLEMTIDRLYIQEGTEGHSTDLAEFLLNTLPAVTLGEREDGAGVNRREIQGWVAPAHFL